MGFDRDSNDIFNCYRLIQEQQIYNPWPNEPIPSGEDTTDYRKMQGTELGVNEVDYKPLLQKYIGDETSFQKLPQDEQVRRVNQLVDDFARQANLSSSWSNDVKNMVNRNPISATAQAIHNFDYSNKQVKDFQGMDSSQQQEYLKQSENFWQNTNKKNQLESEIQNLNNKAEQLDSKIANEKESGKSANELESIRIERINAANKKRELEKQLNTVNAELNPTFKQAREELIAKNTKLNQKSTQPSSTLNSSLQPQTSQQPQSTPQSTSPSIISQSFKNLANDPAIKPIADLNTPNILSKVAQNPLVRTANALNPANLLATGVKAADTLRRNYDVNVTGGLGNQGAYVTGGLTPKDMTSGRSSYMGGAALTPQGLSAGVQSSKYSPQNVNYTTPAKAAQTAVAPSAKPQPPVQSQQPQRQTVYGTNIDPNIPNARRVTTTSPQPPVQPQQSTGARQTSYTSQYLPTDEERLRQRYYYQPGMTATKY